jgi:Raf kinase inhibitor-like YbhB/YbcL family protein
MMLEHVPAWLGHALRDVRAGADKLTILQPELGSGFRALDLSSIAFTDGGRLPERFTADGEGLSPPLAWSEVPEEARSLALIVEDPDAPSLQPLVHAIVWNIPAEERSLGEGLIAEDGPNETGRNSYFRSGWLPPDPPTGHGAHNYAFQLFALADIPDLGDAPGRSTLVEAMAGKVLAAGLLIGTYSRGEAAEIGLAAGQLSPAPS